MITKHYYLKPMEHAGRSTAMYMFYIFASSCRLTTLHSQKEDAALDTIWQFLK